MNFYTKVKTEPKHTTSGWWKTQLNKIKTENSTIQKIIKIFHFFPPLGLKFPIRTAVARNVT